MTSIPDAWPAFQKALEEASVVDEIRKRDREALATALLALKEALKKPRGALQALQIAQTSVLPATIQVVGGGIGSTAAGLDIASALRTFNTVMQGGFNGGGRGVNIDKDAAAAFEQGLRELWNKVLNHGVFKQGLGMDENTFNAMTSTVKSIYGAFKVEPGQPMDIDTLCKTIDNWYTPTIPDPNHPGQRIPDPTASPAPEITTIQNAFQQFNNTVSVPAQQQQIKLQFEGNQYNQYLGTMQQIVNSMKGLLASLVKQQRAG